MNIFKFPGKAEYNKKGFLIRLQIVEIQANNVEEACKKYLEIQGK